MEAVRQLGIYWLVLNEPAKGKNDKCLQRSDF